MNLTAKYPTDDDLKKKMISIMSHLKTYHHNPYKQFWLSTLFSASRLDVNIDIFYHEYKKFKTTKEMQGLKFNECK